MTYNVDKFLKLFFSSQELPLFKNYNKRLLPSNTILFSISDDIPTACTYVHTYNRLNLPVFKMSFGTNVIHTLIDFPKSTFASVAEARTYYKAIHVSFVGLFFHELGHLLYTNMVDSSINSYKVATKRAFIGQLFNILEDVHIEKVRLAVDIPITQKYFRFLTLKLFEPGTSKYRDDGSVSSFLSFLLLRLRCPKAKLFSNKAFDSCSSVILPMISNILHCLDGTKRIQLTIELAEWLFANVNALNYDSAEPIDPSTSTVGGFGSVKSSTTTGAGTCPSSPASSAPTLGATSSSFSSSSSVASNSSLSSGNSSRTSASTPSSSSSSSALPKFSSVDDLEAIEDDSSIEDIYDEKNDIPLSDTQNIEDAYDSNLDVNSLSNFAFYEVKDYFQYNNAIKEYIDFNLSNVQPLSNQVTQSIKLFKGRIRPRYTPGFDNGKLHINSCINSSFSGVPSTKVFSQKIKRAEASDLSVSILCDNSGSMGGNKSYVCTQAMLVLAQACELVNVPVEVNCFTEEEGICYTFCLKSFKDKFKEAKYYFGINDSNVVGHYSGSFYPFFSGNIDEVNLYWLWKSLKTNKHKDKLIIVISDGLTGGSTGDLSNLVKDIINSGINVIGLGIESSAVEKIYPKHKVFANNKSLKDLPSFLTDTLNSLIRGGK